MQLLTLSSPFHMAVFYNILAGLFVWKPDYLNCKHAARLADSDPGGANTHMQTHVCCTLMAYRWKMAPSVPHFIFLQLSLADTCTLRVDVPLYDCESVRVLVCVCVCTHLCIEWFMSPGKVRRCHSGSITMANWPWPCFEPPSQDCLLVPPWST